MTVWLATLNQMATIVGYIIIVGCFVAGIVGLALNAREKLGKKW